MPDVTIAPLDGERVVIKPAPAGEHGLVISGWTNTGSTPITNSGREPIRLIQPDGASLILKPGETVRLTSGIAYRVACNDCSLFDGSHETWCPLWEPYEASS